MASPPAEARDARIDIPATTLPDAIARLARATGVSIGTDGTLPHLRTPALHGSMSAQDALSRLLAGSGYVARRVGANAFRIELLPSQPARPAPARTALPAPDTIDPVSIVVTGTKREQALSRLPMAVAVVDMSAARAGTPALDTAWLAGGIEGLSLTALGPGRNRMFLRGVADSPFNGESQSTVAVQLDDARLTYSAPDPDIRLVDVERVEVLKGPQGSLYGTGALGGIYHIVTRKADLDQASLSVTSGLDAVGGGDASPSGSLVANLPLARTKVAVRFAGYSAQEPGWVDTGTRRNSNDARVLGARASLGAEMGAGWRADVTGFAQWLEAKESQYVYAPGSRSRPAQLAEPHDNDLRHISLRLTRPHGALGIVLSSAVTWHEVGETTDATVGGAGFGLANPRLLSDDRQYRVWDNEARLTGSWGQIDWLGGLSHLTARQTDRSTLSSASGPSLTLDDDRRLASDTAAFGEATVPVADRLKATLGARLFHSNTRETRVTGPGALRREKSRNGMTPSATLAFRPGPDRLLFVRYGSAFRQGGTQVGPDGSPETLDSDELATIEAGWRQRLPGGGSLDLGIHYSWWSNMQADTLPTSGLIETENAGDARIWGVEASLDQPLADGWRAQAGVTWTRANLIRNTLGYHISDRSLPVVPEYTLRGSIARSFRLGPAEARLQLQVRYQGPTHLSFDPALDRPMGRVLESRLEGRAKLRGFELGLSIDNLLGRKADTFAFGNPLRFRTARQYTPQRPTGIAVSLSRDF